MKQRRSLRHSTELYYVIATDDNNNNEASNFYAIWLAEDKRAAANKQKFVPRGHLFIRDFFAADSMQERRLLTSDYKYDIRERSQWKYGSFLAIPLPYDAFYTSERV